MIVSDSVGAVEGLRRRARGLDFVVTGTGRSGTAYAAKVFSEAGLACGHAEYFRSQPGLWERGPIRTDRWRHVRTPVGRVREEYRRARLDVVGDASWRAVPRLPRFAGLVWLQLRHPLKVISSFTSVGFFRDDRHDDRRRFADSFFATSGDEVVDAMRWWVEWNQRAAVHAHLVYGLEGFDADLFAQLLDALAVPEPRRRAEQALAAVPDNVNQLAEHGIAARRLSWDDLPDGPAKDRLARAAAHWGYTPDDEASTADPPHRPTSEPH